MTVDDSDVFVTSDANTPEMPTNIKTPTAAQLVMINKKIAKEVNALISKNGKPVLDYQPEESYKDAYQKFYQTLLKAK